MRGEVQARRREGVGRRRRKWHARRRPESRLGGQGTRGAHLEHAGHGRDVGGVEAQRLVEGRGLPSRREGHAMRGEVRARRREGVGLWRGGSGMHGGKARNSGRLGVRARAERTRNMAYMFVTLDVSKLTGLLKRLACCRVERRACDAGARCAPGGWRAWVGASAKAECTGKAARLKAQGPGTRGAHLEHCIHGRDAGGVPAGNVRVEVLQVIEELVHVGDGRDVPVGDGAVRRSGGIRVSVVLPHRRLQLGLGGEGGRAGPRSPARATIASRGEGRGARPSAADEQLVAGGQGVCVLPESKGGRVIGGGVRAGRRERGY